MAISIDGANSPAAVHNDLAVRASPSFTPPVGRVLVAHVTANTFDAVESIAHSLTDSLGGTWSRRAYVNALAGTSGPGEPGDAEIWVRDQPGGGVAMTVTDTLNLARRGMLKVQVWIGANVLTPVGRVASAHGSGTLASISLTTAYDQSRVIGVYGDWDAGAVPTAAVEIVADGDDGITYTSATIRRAANTTPPGVVTLATTAPTARWNMAAVELRAAPAVQNPNWPQVAHEVALNADPADPDAVPVWTDFTDRVEQWGCAQERQYELDRFEAGTWQGLADNRDGLFDTGNPSSPWWPNLKLSRRHRTRVVWANVAYDVWAGNVDRLPQQWAKIRGQSDLAGIDPLGILALSRRLHGAYVEEILAAEPLAYYPLQEAADAQQFLSLVGNFPAATIVPSKYGAAVVASGVDGLLGVEPGTAVQWSGANGVAKRGTVLQLARNGLGPYTVDQAGTGWAMELWFQAAAPLTDPGILITQVAASPSSIFENGTVRLNTNGTLVVRPAGTSTPGSPRYDDNQPHHAVYTFAPDGITWRLYVDGAQVLTGVLGAGFASNSPRPGWTLVGGLLTSTAQQEFLGTGAAVKVAHVGIYAHEISAAQALAHYTAGATAFAGELSGARIQRLLRYARWAGPALIDAGSSTMGPLVGLDGQRALQVLQDTAAAEVGVFRGGRDGSVVFRGRTARYNLPSTRTFGERADLGEVPYLRDITTVDDTTFLKNEIRLSLSGGTSVVREDQGSQQRHFHRSYEATLNVSTVTELEAAADYLLDRFKDPHTRISKLTIKPSSNPALWPAALATRIGDLVGVLRRPMGATARTLAVIVEGVRHQVAKDEWLTTFTLSLADVEQYWQLGVAGFSELGTTTKLAF